MKHIISLFLIFGISFIGLAQEITVQTQKPKPKTTAKTVKPKPKVKTKAKSQAKVASKTKPKTKAKTTTKPKAKIATIEAATKDGKPVILKSNGTWEYTKDKPVAKEVQKPKETQKPVVKEAQKPVVKETKKPIVKETQKAVVKPTPKPKPIAKTTPTPKPVVKSTPVKCDLNMDSAPSIRGLRLGMSRDEVNLLIPGDRVRVLNSPTIIAYPQYSRTRGFENVYQITAQFFDDHLSELTIEYDSDDKKWKNAKEFAENVSANLNLPYKYWKFSGKNAAASEMQCGDFSVTLDSSSNEVTLQDLGVKEKAKEYR